MSTQMSGDMQPPTAETGPGHIICSGPQNIGQCPGQSPIIVGEQMSGIGQPAASIPPGQFISSGPHSIGGISGQSWAETAAAKRIKAKKAFMVKPGIKLRYFFKNCNSFYTSCLHLRSPIVYFPIVYCLSLLYCSKKKAFSFHRRSFCINKENLVHIFR